MAEQTERPTADPHPLPILDESRPNVPENPPSTPTRRMTSRADSPVQRAYEAGFVAGWAARTNEIAERWADVVVVLRPTVIDRARDRVAIRRAEMAAYAATTGRPEWPGTEALSALSTHRRHVPAGPFVTCHRQPCAAVPMAARRAADRWVNR